MKKICRRIRIVILLLNVLLGVTGCGMVESYKEFYIINISDNLDENYFTSDKLDFAKLEGIVFIPEIKEIHHGEYVIYISAYSETGTEQILIKNVMMRENDNIVLSHDLNKDILFESNENTVCEGWIDGGTFTEDDIEIEDGKKFDLIVQVEVNKDNIKITENISFEINVKGYKSFVAPT